MVPFSGLPEASKESVGIALPPSPLALGLPLESLLSVGRMDTVTSKSCDPSTRLKSRMTLAQLSMAAWTSARAIAALGPKTSLKRSESLLASPLFVQLIVERTVRSSNGSSMRGRFRIFRLRTPRDVANGNRMAVLLCRKAQGRNAPALVTARQGGLLTGKIAPR